MVVADVVDAIVCLNLEDSLKDEVECASSHASLKNASEEEERCPSSLSMTTQREVLLSLVSLPGDLPNQVERRQDVRVTLVVSHHAPYSPTR